MFLRICIVLCIILASDILFAQDNVAVISSQYDESNAVLAPDGKTLYFTIANHILNTGGRSDKGDIWYSQVNDQGIWSTPIKLPGSVNNKFNNRVLGFSSDGLTMYLHGHYAPIGQVIASQGISVSQWNGRSWGFPINIKIPYFQNSSEIQSGQISSDGEVIVFSLQTPRSRGNEDIYVSFKQGASYSEPLNLGNDINTKFQEFTPYLTEDKNILFFSTNGREGEGSSDVFYSRRLDDTWKSWSEPKNVGNWINTEGKDWNFLMIDRIRKILFISTRSSDGYGDVHLISPQEGIDSLFSVDEVVVSMQEELPELDFDLKGVVQDQVGVPISNALVTINNGSSEQEIYTNENGEFGYDLVENTNYAIHVESGLYIPQTRKVQTGKVVEKELISFRLLYAEVGVTVNLQNVLFQKGTYKMLPGSEEELEIVLELLKKNSKIEIELAGHTDNNGDSKENLKLSKKRVQEIKSHLVKKGIPANRITGKGYGDTLPIASNSSEATRKLNRRVEFTIIKNK